MPTRAQTSIDSELAPRLRLAITRTARRMRQEAGSDLGPSQTVSLATIERHGPLSPSELADRERIKRPTATRILAHLEGAGLVERVRDPDDGRGSILSITAEGRALLRRLRARKTAYLAHHLSQLHPDDAAALSRAADVLEHMLEEHPTAELRAPVGGSE
ncbi:MAG: MarR family transcriptional regulator [Actinomycetota bacterium]|nr:MarR family transcriptional regulator [Actinomycetota bacterium]